MSAVDATLGNGNTIVPIVLFDHARDFCLRFPLLVQVNKWGGELCFQVAGFKPEGELVSNVNAGDIAFEPDSSSISLFFGPTPICVDAQRIKSSSRVVVIGRIDEDSLDKIDLFKDGEVLKFLA